MNLNFIKISKAYTEGIYADTPINRKLGRVGMSYKEYVKKLKDEKEENSEKKYYYVRLSDGEEFMLEEGKTSKEKAIDLAIEYVSDMVKYNGYSEFNCFLEENTEDWTDEDIENKDYDWLSITAKKHEEKIEISVFDYNTRKYLRNDTLKRQEKNRKQQLKRKEEKDKKEFETRFGWMEELLEYKKKNIN